MSAKQRPVAESETWLSLSGQAEAKTMKSFLVLFFKKEPLSSACLRCGRYLRASWAVRKKEAKAFDTIGHRFT
jgi:hypothetical protein